MERVKMSKVEVSHGNTAKKFPVYAMGLLLQRYLMNQMQWRWFHAGRKFTNKAKQVFKSYGIVSRQT